MTLPQVDTQIGLPPGFHRGRTIGSIGGVIAAASKRNDVKYDTKTERAIRMRMASLMIRPITSFNQLSDHELQGMLVACTADVDSIAQWLAGQEFEGLPQATEYREEYPGELDGHPWDYY